MSYIKLSGSVLAASSSAAGTYELGISEFQMLDGLTAGTVSASKVVVVDSDSDIQGFRNVDGTGDLTMGTITMPGFVVDADGDTNLKSLAVDNSSTIGCDADTDIMTLAAQSLALASDVDFNVAKAGGLKIAGTAVTATAAELNYLDNDDLTAADIVKLAALTATAAEINYLDNDDLTAADITKLAALTATAAEINYLDNDDLTAADLQKLADITATAAEINDLASNAVDGADFTKLSNVTSTAAELNLLDTSVAGTVVNSKAVIYGASGQVNGTSLSASAAVSGHSLDIETSANIAGNIDSAGDLTVASITMAEFAVDSSGNTDVDGTLNVEGVATFQGAANAASLSASAAVSGHSLDIETSANIAGNIDSAGDLTVASITMAEFSVDSSGNTDVDGTLNVEGVPTFQAGAVFSSGITTAGAVAGATTVSGSGLFSMSAIDNDGVLNNEGAANIVGKLTVSAVSDLDGGIDVNNSKFTVSAAGAMLASSAKVADIGDGGIVFGSGGDGELSADAALGWHAGTSTLLAANVSSSANLMAKGTLSANGESNLYAAANVHGTFTALGQADLSGDVNIGNATSDTLTVTARFDSDLLPSSDSARDLGSSALQWAEIHADAGHIDAMTVSGLSALASVSSSAGMHITAGSGPYSLEIADGAGDAIAQAWVTHSDRNLKTNIQEMDNNAALNAVMSLQPSTYEKKASGKSEIGFIAQEVAQVVPEICALDANGVGRGIDYSRMSTLLAGALKAQQEQIAQLKEIVAKLQK